MRVFIITQDEPVYAPLYLRKIVEKTRGRHVVVGLAALSVAGRKGWVSFLRDRLGIYGPRDFSLAVIIALRARLRTSLRASAQKFGIALIDARKVNDPGFIERVRGLQPDVILSVASPQKFGRDLLAAARVVCLNVHSAMLPRHRGMDALFWTMLQDEKEAGVTVHVMSDKLDEGGIVEQQAFPVADGDTLHDLYLRSVENGSTLVARALDRYEAGPVELRPNRAAEGDYHSAPTPDAGRRFRAARKRFF